MPKQEEFPKVETVPAEEKGDSVFVRPDGTTVTREEAQEEKERRDGDPNWFREQR
ncbi:MAG: hypothetical protein V1696_02105 [Candidatus Jorgensenbacteria bacterium]